MLVDPVQGTLSQAVEGIQRFLGCQQTRGQDRNLSLQHFIQVVDLGRIGSQLEGVICVEQTILPPVSP